MLKQHEASETPLVQNRFAAEAGSALSDPESAELARVTPEEAALALAAVEARRRAAELHSGQTISVSEVVKQLGVDVSPEEIVAEVEIIRREAMERDRSATQTAIRSRRKRRWGFGAGALALLFGGFALFAGLSQPSAKSPAEIARFRNEFAFRPGALVQDRQANGIPILRSFSEIPDGHTVRATLTVTAGSDGYYVAQQDFVENAGVSKGWQILKHDGQPYVRGYITPMSDTALATAQSVTVYSEPEQAGAAGTAQGITLPLHNLKLLGEDMYLHIGQGYFTATDLHPDSHLHESWKKESPDGK